MKFVKHYGVIISFDEKTDYDRCLYIVGNIHGYLSAYCVNDPADRTGYDLTEIAGEKLWKMAVDTTSRRFRKFENVVTCLYGNIANFTFVENIG